MREGIMTGYSAYNKPEGEPSARNRPSRLHTLIAVLLLAVMNFGSHFGANLGVKIMPIDVVTAAFLGYVIFTRHFYFRLDGSGMVLFLLLFLSFFIEMFSVVVIDGGATENVTLGVAVLRNAALIFIIMQINYDQSRVRAWLMYVGVFFSLAAIAGYLYAQSIYSQILSTRSMWESDVFWTMEAGHLRLQGLQADPNFFFIVNLIPLFFGISLVRDEKSIRAFAGTGIILAASVLTFSRSGAVLLALLLLVFFAGDIARVNVTKLFVTFAVLIALFIAAHFISAAYNLPYVEDIIVERFERGTETGGSGRLYLWSAAWDGFKDAMVFGKGGRYIFREYGQYVHNDFLEMLSSHGLAGFISMMSMWIYIAFHVMSNYFQRRGNVLFLYASLLFFFLFVVSFFFTMYYQPFIWFVVALIFTARGVAGGKAASGKEGESPRQ
ncbi:MAG: O-antigen ligase family protein [Deltaproteobacteria bacterium]|nr:O-antigen ligase family protein [Deltaproteobacteria bacterium]